MTAAFVYCGVRFVRDGNRRLKGILAAELEQVAPLYEEPTQSADRN